jgi:hypothetical protein
MTHTLLYFWKKAHKDVKFPFLNSHYTQRAGYLANAHKPTWKSALKVVIQELRDLYGA